MKTITNINTRCRLRHFQYWIIWCVLTVAFGCLVGCRNYGSHDAADEFKKVINKTHEYKKVCLQEQIIFNTNTLENTMYPKWILSGSVDSEAIMHQLLSELCDLDLLDHVSLDIKIDNGARQSSQKKVIFDNHPQDNTIQFFNVIVQKSDLVYLDLTKNIAWKAVGEETRFSKDIVIKYSDTRYGENSTVSFKSENPLVILWEDNMLASQQIINNPITILHTINSDKVTHANFNIIEKDGGNVSTLYLRMRKDGDGVKVYIKKAPLQKIKGR